MRRHRNPQASVSKQAPSDNFNTIDTTCEPLLISPHLLPEAVDVRIADIFALAIRHRAVALLVAHNHPSGDPTPSEYDYELTKDLPAPAEGGAP